MKMTSTTCRTSSHGCRLGVAHMRKRNTYLAPAKAMLKHVGRRALDIAKDEGRDAYYRSGMGRAFKPVR